MWFSVLPPWFSVSPWRIGNCPLGEARREQIAAPVYFFAMLLFHVSR
jgi:hypothetical protein